jgi:DNA ligase 1
MEWASCSRVADRVMRLFAQLYERLDRTTSTNAKVAALAAYFAEAPPADAAWALFFLTGQRLKRLLPSAALRTWAEHASGVPGWLIDESHEAVGDAAETIALVLDLAHTAAGTPDVNLPLSSWIENRILPLRGASPEAQERDVIAWWRALDRAQRFLLTKLLTGGLRVGVSHTLVVRALAQVAGTPRETIAHRLMGQWQPSAAFFQSLLTPDTSSVDRSRPYPFYLASPLDREPAALGPRQEWLAEWKWDGIRAQVIRRGGETYIWSRGEELVTDRFPELHRPAERLPDGTVIDGEIVAFDGERPLPFALLQRRIGRRKLTASVLRDAPAGLLAYDLLEDEGRDVRIQALSARRGRLAVLVQAMGVPAVLSPEIEAVDWTALAAVRERSREHAAEGLMLKRLAAPYLAGRKRGDWWKWKIDPFSVDAVLIYAQPGSGRRSSLFTDYTFAVWTGAELVPFAKAYSGLSDAEIAELDRWIRRHTVERFGPVRHVEPVQVFELGFEGISRSPRHRSGVAVRFPRILRWRRDKPARDADTLESVEGLIA